jgi:hypothetical protein
MCVNLQTSILAFIIGEISGFLLAIQNNEKKQLVYLLYFILLFNYVRH